MFVLIESADSVKNPDSISASSVFVVSDDRLNVQSDAVIRVSLINVSPDALKVVELIVRSRLSPLSLSSRIVESLAVNSILPEAFRLFRVTAVLSQSRLSLPV